MSKEKEKQFGDLQRLDPVYRINLRNERIDTFKIVTIVIGDGRKGERLVAFIAQSESDQRKGNNEVSFLASAPEDDTVTRRLNGDSIFVSREAAEQQLKYLTTQ